MNAPMYSGLFFLLIFLWPFFLPLVLPYQLMVLILNGAIIANVWYQCSSRECGYFQGFMVVSGSYMSGCANITLLYLPFILVILFVPSVYWSIRAFFVGKRQDAQRSWIEWVITMGRLK